MSTKCTILHGEGYHFYFDYKDVDYHLDWQDAESQKRFLRKAGKILEGCSYSDSGLYFINVKEGTSEKKYSGECKECQNNKNQNDSKHT